MTSMASDHALPRVGRFGFADYPPQIWLLLGGSFLVRALGFAYPFMAYFVIERGHGPAVVSIVVASCGAGWVLGLLVCGSLVDRIGGRLTLMTAMIGAAGVLCALAVSHSVPMLVGGAVLFGFLFDAPRPIISAAITELIPDSGQRARIDAFRYGWVVNGGGAITGALGGLLALRIGVPALFLVHAAACAVFAVLAPHSPRPQRVSVSQVSELLSARRPGSSSPSESSTGSRRRNGAACITPRKRWASHGCHHHPDRWSARCRAVPPARASSAEHGNQVTPNPKRKEHHDEYRSISAVRRP